MLGTPAAMAPEQMRGQPVDARTDVYALGLLAYHMLTGQPAFGGGPGVVQTYLQIHGARPRPSSKVDIDPAIDEPISRALAPEPDDRFQTARALIEALKAVIHPTSENEVDVVALYVEATPIVVEKAKQIAERSGMQIALAAPDSVLAVAERDRIDIERLKVELSTIGDLHGALGMTRASVSGRVIDGPALDVEGWAPYPLDAGLWVGSGV
jgi:serine/threonine protein kinase